MLEAARRGQAGDVESGAEQRHEKDGRLLARLSLVDLRRLELVVS